MTLLYISELITTEDVKPVKSAPAAITASASEQPSSTTNSETVKFVFIINYENKQTN